MNDDVEIVGDKIQLVKAKDKAKTAKAKDRVKPKIKKIKSTKVELKCRPVRDNNYRYIAYFPDFGIKGECKISQAELLEGIGDAAALPKKITEKLRLILAEHGIECPMLEIERQ